MGQVYTLHTEDVVQPNDYLKSQQWNECRSVLLICINNSEFNKIMKVYVITHS